MQGLGALSFPAIVASVDDWNRFNILCDVGGGSGNLAGIACEMNQKLEAIIFDLPQIEKHVLHYVEKLSASVGSRIRFHGGDFFLDNLPQADIYTLGRILHDWTEEQCSQLLNKIYYALPKRNGAVLIAECLLDDNKTGPLPAVIHDIVQQAGLTYTKAVVWKNIKENIHAVILINEINNKLCLDCPSKLNNITLIY
ncbi:unnamed protein product [Adineta steineri]|uniref:Acetylserotonin O-methyltransferase n=1 Tax=Adineta steineri TaxID=433720 RepID=A0A813XPN0_9BILA|nr:unnamed protein product [Adineta steineri]CAF0893879.1 unnamed protein product [Adineta steineri]CAF0963533.1 unnamed protein product [Adineta steineri]